jgi:hypothetical protein
MPEQEQRRESRPPRGPGEGGRGPGEGGRGPDRGGRRDDRRDDRYGDRGRPEGPPEIELEKLMQDSLYLDNQAHGIVSRMRDMDSGTKSQLRRLYSAVRRAAAWTSWKSYCCKSRGRTTCAATNVFGTYSRPSWPTTSKST